MQTRHFLIAAALVLASAGCSSVASSKANGNTAKAWSGPVVVLQSSLPAGIEFKDLGSVKANARGGYSSVESLYPILATEARKMGANAVINAKGGRTVTAWSWAAPYVGGTAVRVDNIEQLKGLPGAVQE
jgi:hypothetical protein